MRNSPLLISLGSTTSKDMEFFNPLACFARNFHATLKFVGAGLEGVAALLRQMRENIRFPRSEIFIPICETFQLHNLAQVASPSGVTTESVAWLRVSLSHWNSVGETAADFLVTVKGRNEEGSSEVKPTRRRRRKRRRRKFQILYDRQMEMKFSAES